MGEYSTGFNISIHNEKDITAEELISEAILI